MIAVPPIARKLAHYWYDGGKEIIVYAKDRNIFVRDQHGEMVVYLDASGRKMMDPFEGTEMGDFSYETLGLFFGYGMSETGWSGDC